MSWLSELITNPYLITATSSWCVAQLLKVIIHAAVYRTLDLKRLFGDGGMPSGHSATVTSLAVLTALTRGVGSFDFAVTAILALIVCHDAKGVRQEAGKHAVLLDELVTLFKEMSSEPLPEVRLKKFVGHTPLQVAAGIGIGAANAVGIYFLFF